MSSVFKNTLNMVEVEGNRNVQSINWTVTSGEIIEKDNTNYWKSPEEEGTYRLKANVVTTKGESITIDQAVSVTAPIEDSGDSPEELVESADEDGDGLSNSDELNIYSTNPYNADSDFDGIDDYTEIQKGTDPLSL